jgi:hypothetical protein
MPLSRMKIVATTLNTPEVAAKAVKNQPLPITSSNGCMAATAAADRAHRVMLPAAAAVLVFCGDMSTIRVLCV